MLIVHYVTGASQRQTLKRGLTSGVPGAIGEL